jgi:Co/Zn/Cd efflux system component
MIENNNGSAAAFHGHVFLGEAHEKSERKTWAVIWLCGVMMVAEIIGDCLSWSGGKYRERMAPEQRRAS